MNPATRIEEELWALQNANLDGLKLINEAVVLLTQRPATRIGRSVIFEGGGILRLSRWEWALFALGLKTTVKRP